MLNSTTTNRLRADFESRRRSSTGQRPPSFSTSRQVHRIYDEDAIGDFINTSGSDNTQSRSDNANNTTSTRQKELVTPSIYNQKKKPRSLKRKSSVRYSIHQRVHPWTNEEDTTKGSTSQRTTSIKEERRGSRLRYSIARRIKSHRQDQSDIERITINDLSTDTNNEMGIERQHQTSHWFIILPSNKYRIAWDVFMAWLLASMAFYIPFRVCMFWDSNSEEQSGIFWFELFTDVVFAFDIVINFISGYYDPSSKCLVSNPRRIAMRYLKGYFLFDVIATIPFSYILSSSNGSLVANKLGKLGRLPRMVRFLKAVRLLKLLRVYKLKDFVSKLETEYNIHHGITKMIKILATVLLVTHLSACFWHLVGISGGDDIFEGGWMYRYSFDQKSTWLRYVASLYWSFSTLTTVGYGDISARTPQEMIYSMIQMLLGVSWYAYIVSSMATVMSSFDAISAAVREKMVCVNEFIRGAKLPPQLGKQVRSYFEFKLANSQRVFLMNKHYDADELLYELSSSLRADIMLYMEQNLVKQIPFFENKVNQFVADTLAMFQPIVCHEDEFIVKEGNQADEMFFLTKGRAAVLYGTKHVFTLEEGSYFGELGCLVGGVRRAGIKALTTCELQALSRRNLNTLIMEYPDVGEELQRVAAERADIVKEEKKSSKSQRTKKSSNNRSKGFDLDSIVDTHLKETMEKIKKDAENNIRLM